MSEVTKTNSYNSYKKEYIEWRREKDFRSAKRQEYLRRNPDAIKDYDLQRVKILLSAVDMMDKSVSNKSDNIGTYFESLANMGLGYGAIGGASLGYFFRKTDFAKKLINKSVKNSEKSKHIITMSLTSIFGALGILSVYPLYLYLSNIQSKINRKRRFDTMEKELQDPKIFVVLDSEQKTIFKKNLEKIKKDKKPQSTNLLKKELKSIKQISKELINYNKNQTEIKDKYSNDKTFYEKELSDKEIRKAKKDKVLLSVLIKEINTRSQTYTEKMDRITNNIITSAFAFGSLFVLGYERLAKTLKLKHSSFPAGLGFFLFTASTIFGTWATKRAGEVGRFNAHQELMKNPEQLVYISNRKTDTIDDSEITVEERKNVNSIKFLKNFFKHNKEYNEWKKRTSLTGKDITKAMENIELSPEQIKDGEHLKNNMFKTFYKVDKNTQNYSSKIQLANESLKYPIALTLGTLGSISGLKHLAKIRSASTPIEVLKNTLKYIANVLFFITPTFFINSYFARAQKMGARISDMITMKELEDYRFFADYSRFESSEVVDGQSD